MATGNIILSPGAATSPDGTTSNLAPALQRVKSSGTAPGIYLLQLAFDASLDEWTTFQFRMPDDYASAPVAKLDFKMTSATSGNVQWDVRVAAVTSGDAFSVNAKVFGSANTATAAVPATAGYMTETSVTLTNADSLSAGDFVVLRVCRVGSDAADTATGDAELVQMTLAYTTV